MTGGIGDKTDTIPRHAAAHSSSMFAHAKTHWRAHPNTHGTATPITYTVDKDPAVMYSHTHAHQSHLPDRHRHCDGDTKHIWMYGTDR